MARQKRREEKRETAAHRVREYIDAHPSIRDCLQMDLINLSALARKIVKETDADSEDAARGREETAQRVLGEGSHVVADAMIGRLMLLLGAANKLASEMVTAAPDVVMAAPAKL